jgi:hypothetical protein
MPEVEPIPPDSIWFDPSVFRRMIAEWLKEYQGIPFAHEAMENANGDWTRA